MPRKSKYKARKSDGIKQTSKTYTDFGKAHYTGKKYFSGLTDDIIDQKIKEFEASLNAGIIEPGKPKETFGDFVDEWWEYKQAKLELNSISSYKAKKKEIKEVFGSYQIEEIDAPMIYEWLDGVVAKGYAKRGVKDRKSVLKNIMDYAIIKKKIKVNPCKYVPDAGGKAAVKRHAANEEDIKRIEAAKTDDLIGRMYYFMEYAGCRVGECVVLQEKNIDRKNKLAKIVQTLAFDGQKPVVKIKPKTEAGFREVDLYDNVLEILPEYDDPETFIFFPDGLPRKSPYETALKNYRKQHGITATCHQLRHTYAGIMHSAEIDVKDTQARMGHANAAVTQDIYMEIEKAHNEKARNKANRFIMEERLGKEKIVCPVCGGNHTMAEDGHRYSFCPDCGAKLPEVEEIKEISKNETA